MSVSDASILWEGLGLGGARHGTGLYVCERESWPHALFSLRLSGRQAAKSRAVPLGRVGRFARAFIYSLSLSLQSISIHHSQSSQSIFIYDREIGAKISVSISISRFLRLENLLYGSCKVRFLQTISKSRETSSSLDEDRRRVGQHSALVVARAAAEHAEEARRLRGGLALALGPAREVEAHLGKYHATCGPE